MTRVGAGLSTAAVTVEAAAAAAEAARDRLEGGRADLAFMFMTPEHLARAHDAVDAVQATLGPRCLIGATASGVIGGEQELEQGPAISVWAASTPGARLAPFHVTAEQRDDELVLVDLPELDDAELVVLLADPFTLPVAALLESLNAAAPERPIVGGIATGGGRPGAQALVCDRDVFREGAVGVSVSGVAVEAVVSQGCAPLGGDAVVTRAEGNVVYELAGRPALERLREIVAGLSASQRALAARGLLAGIVIDENKPDYERGDFLMRSILGADEDTGAIAIGELVRIGQTLRFHARDAGSADSDLRLALEESLARSGPPAGALLFTCNGRGTNMFETPDHDAQALASVIGGPALAGFFCGGEIGPVGGRSFLHGFTATMALFRHDADTEAG